MSTLPSKRKPYQQPLSNNWWQTNSAYRQYMMRSATCVVVIFYALNLFWALTAMYAGEHQFNLWLQYQQTRLSISLHGFGLLAMLYHSKTWFMLAPKTVHVQWGANKVADKKIEAVMWLLWIVVTLVILLIVL